MGQLQLSLPWALAFSYQTTSLASLNANLLDHVSAFIRL